ncbi:RNA polymerase sigma factor [Pseudobacteriovorax antillogorgiicola]|uniref:RNA polymerase, sigma subunit, ECF family n=1 Tax=Pseudobacteriovorax antillogorgiicola TaxID=1513793 RepID=A0A1Y6CNI7_9BACT|nr:RNA polymerase sigma factor [Pseudobacteriovorax antillogorgiicola]TCS43643.1 RNA polymerase ECF family sigma subunit [Pseudobacteriovorax antillogorgiicola]SMF79942.1 RNA polymerase, sigma subunit, ECF family [Pseudobacteriovorax antillogorgiicola]
MASDQRNPPSLEEKWHGWMMAAQNGERNAYTLLLRELAHFLPRYVVKHVQNQQMADDICQEVLVSIHKARHTWNSERAFMPWLMAIVKHRTIDEIRKWARVKKAEIIDERYDQLLSPSNTEDEVLAAELGNTLNEAIKNLPEKQRQSFRLLKLEGHSVKEASTITGISQSAIKVSAHRAYKSLKKSIGWFHEA